MGRTITYSAAETAALGEKLAGHLHGGEIIAFRGGMGAGKTTFCRGLAKGLGVLDEVSSPSYALVHLYRGQPALAHFDAWRIQSPEDLEAAGFYEYLEQGAVLAVEWSENLAGWLEEPVIRVQMCLLPDGGREILIEGVEGL